MGNKVIKIELSESGIDKAIAELEAYKQEIIQKALTLRTKVAERLQEYAEQGFAGAIVDDIIYTKEGKVRAKAQPITADVTVSVTHGDTLSIVFTQGSDAVWVEFGTGVYHNGTPGSSPHPHGAELGMLIGTYGDGNGKKGTWGFNKDGTTYLTHGTPAKMPMSQSMNTVLNEIASIAKEVFG